jgi:ribosomal protein L1
VLEDVVRKVGKQNMKSVYVKLTMSKPMKLVGA